MAEEDLFPSPTPVAGQEPETSDELDALEFIRRVEASDVGPSTVEGVQLGIHRLCRQYTSQKPTELLPQIRTYRHYLTRLIDGRATLTQRRDLIAVGGLLALLTACVHEDLGQRRASELSSETARRAGEHAGHRDLIAWSFEIKAWQALLDGRYPDALEHCQAGLMNADAVSSAAAQLIAQTARASARLGDKDRTLAALEHAEAMADRLRPEWPDHHFVFDPSKLTSYTATTLAWLGDGSDEAERCARRVIREEGRLGRPRRVATARVDLAMILLARHEAEEAAHLGRLAVKSGRLVPSNVWRVAELDRSLRAERSNAPEIAAFHEQFEAVRQAMRSEPA
ncbi:hypothetical protein [Actinoallomurus soli]|uniref:hypothetical protein n=1 Tax=Actinoallomurus soli TaxID=2952535 RepID=UPI0020932DA7|nr:hypothetical protein [Actinoallomurus soli]MCO5974836.1 hypothetical protein [Actinoallomurus soli]